jgi:hypothetical protein
VDIKTQQWCATVRWWLQYAPLKRRSTSTRLNGATSQMTAIFILLTVRTLNITNPNLYLHGRKWRQHVPPKRWYAQDHMALQSVRPTPTSHRRQNIKSHITYLQDLRLSATFQPCSISKSCTRQSSVAWIVKTLPAGTTTLQILLPGLHSSLFLAGDSQVVQLKMNDSLFAIYWTKNNCGYTNT